MAIEVIAWMYQTGKDMGGERGLTPAEMAVALSYANHARKDGTGSFPSTETVMEETRLSRSSVFRARDQLVKHGVLQLDEGGLKTKRVGRYSFPAMRASASATTTPSKEEMSPTVRLMEESQSRTVTHQSRTERPMSPTVRLMSPTVTPNTSLPVTQPSEEPETSRVRDDGHLTVLRERDDAGSEGQDSAGGEDAYAIWQRRNPDWLKTATRAAMPPPRMAYTG